MKWNIIHCKLHTFKIVRQKKQRLKIKTIPFPWIAKIDHFAFTNFNINIVKWMKWMHVYCSEEQLNWLTMAKQLQIHWNRNVIGKKMPLWRRWRIQFAKKKDLSLYQIHRGDLISWVKMIFSKIFFLFFWYGHLNNRKKTITRMLFDIYKTMNQKVYTESRAIKLELVCNFSLWGCSSICAQSFCVPEFQWMKVSRHPFLLFLQLIPIDIYIENQIKREQLTMSNNSISIDCCNSHNFFFRTEKRSDYK